MFNFEVSFILGGTFKYYSYKIKIVFEIFSKNNLKTKIILFVGVFNSFFD